MRSVSTERFLLALATVLLAPVASAQPAAELVDGIVSVVGKEVVLLSDLRSREQQIRQQGAPVTMDATCEELESLLFEKLLIDQARLDSVEVDDGQVQAELDRRIRYFMMQLGSQEKLEEFYGKSIEEIKADFHDQVKEQLLVQQMQQQVVGGVRATPRQVEGFYKDIPADSLPFINAQVEIAQIVRTPRVDPAEDRRVRQRIEEFRTSVVNGDKDFCTLAILYSEDPGSAKDCGELGLVPLGAMVSEFDAVAMSLKEGETSQVFKTTYGYHFMQLVERRGEQYNARHILLKPQVGSEDLAKARRYVDSLATLIRAGTLEFSSAANEYSDDEESRSNGGVLIEPNSNSPLWAIGELDQQTFLVVDKLAVQQVSEPVVLTAEDGTKSFRILRVLQRTEPHKANLKDDYQLLLEAAENKLKSDAMDGWVKEKLITTYIKVDPAYTGCPFLSDWSVSVDR
ncbi:MAG: peptidylprolyl isomerase [Flavobacteriales bacterium]|nr:peptidylprolyl isomerase [Flavobacteriales bacterium]MBK6754930.1 peptidylprolyl isomerase [Flavobacteriales bacterium]MBK7271115.1 peptidylprolyl isomerase [Flavobacteriales bacterium]MBK9074958.1 peptidylprolyl isomerase [Flavobacteriales bacterium]MBK9540183.1 peptidylprolyl isomerase [Flavobacteriales bacterium]